MPHSILAVGIGRSPDRVTIRNLERGSDALLMIAHRDEAARLALEQALAYCASSSPPPPTAPPGPLARNRTPRPSWRPPGAAEPARLRPGDCQTLSPLGLAT